MGQKSVESDTTYLGAIAAKIQSGIEEGDIPESLRPDVELARRRLLTVGDSSAAVTDIGSGMNRAGTWQVFSVDPNNPPPAYS